MAESWANWIKPFDESSVNLNTIKEIQSYDNFVKKNPDFDLDQYFDEPIEPYLDELAKYDIIDFGWYFRHKLDLLVKLENIQGLIFGHWFDQDLNVLETLPNLKFVQVRYSYNRATSDIIHEKIFRL